MTASATRNLRLPYSVLQMRAWFDSPLLGAWGAQSRGRIGLAYSHVAAGVFSV
jgi:hypothetical protein